MGFSLWAISHVAWCHPCCETESAIASLVPQAVTPLCSAFLDSLFSFGVRQTWPSEAGWDPKTFQ